VEKWGIGEELPVYLQEGKPEGLLELRRAFYRRNEAVPVLQSV
jgi:hypothetical protein